MEEQKSLFTAPQYLGILRRDSEKSTALKVKNSPEVQTPLERLNETSSLVSQLRQTKKLSEGEFEKIFAYRAKESEEFFKLISLRLPQLSNDQLIYLIDFTNSEVEKHWALRARCVAEAYSRCPKLQGGRNKVAPVGEGRENLAKELAARYKTSITNIRLDEKIIRLFGKYEKITIETSADPAGVSTEGKPKFTRSKDNKFFESVAVQKISNPNIVGVTTFQPHPKLTRGHYVIASRFYDVDAREIIKEAIEKVEAGISYTAAEMEAEYFPRKNQRIGYFQIEKLQHPNSAFKFEITLSEEDTKLLFLAFRKELGIETDPFHRDYARSRVKQQGYDSFKRILEKYLELESE